MQSAVAASFFSSSAHPPARRRAGRQAARALGPLRRRARAAGMRRPMSPPPEASRRCRDLAEAVRPAVAPVLPGEKRVPAAPARLGAVAALARPNERQVADGDGGLHRIGARRCRRACTAAAGSRSPRRSAPAPRLATPLLRVRCSLGRTAARDPLPRVRVRRHHRHDRLAGAHGENGRGQGDGNGLAGLRRPRGEARRAVGTPGSLVAPRCVSIQASDSLWKIPPFRLRSIMAIFGPGVAPCILSCGPRPPSWLRAGCSAARVGRRAGERGAPR